MLTICTGWSPAGYREYGKRFVDTFARYWPADVNLLVFGEEPVELPAGRFISLETIPDCGAFIEKHGPRAIANGRERIPEWKPREVAAGYSYRFDAVKFCRQGFIPEAALQYLPRTKGDQFLAWLDADVYTHSPVPRGFIEGLLPDGFDVAYLGRGEKHPEIGFQLYRIGPTSSAVELLVDFAALYRSDAVFKLREWHSAYAWNVARTRSGVPSYDLTPGGRGHVWHQSPLRLYTDHLKGERKKNGRSPERR